MLRDGQPWFTRRTLPLFNFVLELVLWWSLLLLTLRPLRLLLLLLALLFVYRRPDRLVLGVLCHLSLPESLDGKDEKLSNRYSGSSS